MSDQLPSQPSSSASLDNDDLRFLEQMLRESVAAQKKKPAIRVDDVFSNVKAARARLQMPSVMADEREKLLADIDRWEQAYIWVTVGLAAMVGRQSCSCCGSVTHSPLGYFRHQQGRKDRNAQRWVKVKAAEVVDTLAMALPREVTFQDTTSEFCLNCLDIGVFDIAAGKVRCLTPALVESLHENQ